MSAINSNSIVIFLTIVIIVTIIYIITKDLFFSSNKIPSNTISKSEHFGALQSLYSNDGPQDAYLTIENDPAFYYDPYGYWRGVTWNLPTRNLSTVSYSPYLYERYIDRYNTFFPYWSM